MMPSSPYDLKFLLRISREPLPETRMGLQISTFNIIETSGKSYGRQEKVFLQ